MTVAQKIIEPGMAVLIVTPWYKPSIGGVAEVADRLHVLLERSGVETHLLVCDWKGPRHLQPDTGGRNIWRINIPSYIIYDSNPKAVLATLIRGASTVRQLLEFIRHREIQTVFLLYPTDYVWPFLLIKYLAKVKIIASCHGSDLAKYEGYPFGLRYLMRRTLLVADAVTVCAKHLEMIARKIAWPNAVDIHLIANCVDSDHFLPPEERLARPDMPVSLIHVSNFSPVKRTKDIVRAFAMASLPSETRLIMVGCGPDHGETRKLAEDIGIIDRVAFVGTQKDVRPYLWKADIFVLASEREGDPLVLLEAMAAGLPWISTPWGAAEQLPSGECGLVVPAGSLEKLAAAMEELVGDSEKRERMGRRGRERAETDFNVHAYAQKHCGLIQLVQGASAKVLA